MNLYRLRAFTPKNWGELPLQKALRSPSLKRCSLVFCLAKKEQKIAMLPAAIGIILSEDKTEILLVRRKDTPVWVIPGGGVEPGESAEDALKREIQEETGLTVKIEKKSAEYTPINRLASFTTVFLCTIVKGDCSLSSETSAIQFFPLNNLPSNLFKIHREWIQEALISTTLIQKPLNQITYFAVINHFIRHPLQVLRYLWTRFTKA